MKSKNNNLKRIVMTSDKNILNVSKIYTPKFSKSSILNIILITLDSLSNELFVKNLNILPNIRELVDNGVYFENAFSIGPTTSFSFPGIIGGVYPYYFGIGVHKNVKSIYGILKEKLGYNTAFINESNALLTPFFGYGKKLDYQEHLLDLSHVDVDRKLRKKFLEKEDKEILKKFSKHLYLVQRIYEKLDNKWIKTYLKHFFHFYKFLRLAYLKENTEEFWERKKLYCAFRSKILEFINKRFKKPQFLWIHSIVNHLPYFPPENTDKFHIDEINSLNYKALAGLVNNKICEKLKLLYIESLKRTDELIKDIIYTLKENRLLKNSIVIITSDHGEEFMEEGYFGHAPESSSDRLLNVPLIFYCPTMFKHKRISYPVSTIDIPPTIVDLLGLKIPNSFRGVSLKDILLDSSRNLKKYQRFWRRSLFSEAWEIKSLLDRNPGYISKKEIFTIRKGKYKLKVIREHRNRNIIIEELYLINWINNEKINLTQSNKQILTDLYLLLWSHIHREGIFANRYVEQEKVKSAIQRLRKSGKL